METPDSTDAGSSQTPQGSSSAEHYEDQLKSANEKLYSHSLELATRNKTLSLLRKLYQISILALDPDTLADKIVHTVREELQFELVSILRFDSANDTLSSCEISRSERLEKLAAEHHPFHTNPILNASKHEFLAPVFKGQVNHSEKLSDLWGGAVPDDVLAHATDEAHIRTVIAYPLFIDKKLTDVLVLCFNRRYDELSDFEQESLASIVDVTAVALDRARLYQELQRLNGDLTNANKQQVTLIHFITHQLKGYVAKSRNIFSMLQEGDYGPVSENMKPIIEEGFTSSTKGAQTIQEILNAANIKSGQVAYENVSFDFKELVDSILATLKPNADAKGVALTITEPDGPVMFTGDHLQMENALKNLIDNSIKYTPQGSIKVTLTQEAGTIRLVIEDTGVGITKEDMARLFTEGGHGAESQKVNVDSTGFGLYIVKNIIEGHKGTVWAESEGAGKGSKFIVELPVS